MRKNNPVENELNTIRIDFYEKTKNMSTSEKIAFIKAQTAPVHKIFGIETIAEVQMDTRKRVSV